MGRGGSNPPSDTYKLPPPSREPDLIERHVQARRALDGDFQGWSGKMERTSRSSSTSTRRS